MGQSYSCANSELFCAGDGDAEVLCGGGHDEFPPVARETAARGEMSAPPPFAAMVGAGAAASAGAPGAPPARLVRTFGFRANSAITAKLPRHATDSTP